MLTTVTGWITSNILGTAAMLLGLMLVSVWGAVNELRNRARAIALNAIPSVEDENPGAAGEEKMDLVLTAIWTRLAVPLFLVPAMNLLFGRIVRTTAQWVFDTYFAEEFAKRKEEAPPSEPTP